MPLNELNHFMVVCKDLETSMRFYRDLLGMEIADRPDFGFPGYWLKIGDHTCVHLASQEQSANRDRYLLKEHPPGTTGSGSVDHIAFVASQPKVVRERLRNGNAQIHYRSLPDSKLFQMFLKDPDGLTIELNFFGEIINADDWTAEDAVSNFVRTR
ncbi:MAG TPA: VOC family protein [Planktothrix sp.]|jgi:catechol 2,3-dioxygenase-like lactoylglutathione lyase family enzyme